MHDGIRIVPEWNVKNAIDPRIEITRGIRIVPEWNVKVLILHCHEDEAKLESYQSGM